MSSFGTSDVRKRPDLWSYISFTGKTSRRNSFTLPTRNNDDPYEKPDRHRNRSTSLMGEIVPSAKPNWIKYGAVTAVVFFLIFLFSPGTSKVKNYVGGKRMDFTTSVKTIKSLTSPLEHSPFHDGQKVSDPAAGTAKCTKSYSPEKPLTQYALMIDAGSTGSRIHIYKFNNCGPTPELEGEVFRMTEKKEGGSGLSSYDADAEGAARSLDVLMDVAVQSVPEAYRSCSPVAVKATAGLRKLGMEKSTKILEAVRRRLDTAYPFPLVSDAKAGVEVMDGTDEGVYAWITTNYLLGKIGGPDQIPTAAVFDLGGGSTQIVFQPTFPKPNHLEEGDHKYALSFGGRDFELYQHSYLGYGLMEARKSLHKAVVLEAYNKDPQSLNAPLSNPCIAPGMSRDVDVVLDAGHPLGAQVTVKMVGPATGSPAQCRAIAEKTLLKNSECKLMPCAFNGVHQPPLAKTFEKEDIYLFSYFYDRMNPLGMPDNFKLSDIKDITSKVCAGESGWSTFKGVPGALEELRGRPEHCLDLNFMLALLHTGYEMPMDREVKIAKSIGGNELGWCLGARFASLCFAPLPTTALTSCQFASSVSRIRLDL